MPTQESNATKLIEIMTIATMVTGMDPIMVVGCLLVYVVRVMAEGARNR